MTNAREPAFISDIYIGYMYLNFYNFLFQFSQISSDEEIREEEEQEQEERVRRSSPCRAEAKVT